MKACPQCKSKSRIRKRRNDFQKVFTTRKYVCCNCGTTYAWIKGVNISLKV